MPSMHGNDNTGNNGSLLCVRYCVNNCSAGYVRAVSYLLVSVVV